MLQYLTANLPLAGLALVALVAIVYLWRELQRTRRALAEAVLAAAPAPAAPRKRVRFEDSADDSEEPAEEERSEEAADAAPQAGPARSTTTTVRARSTTAARQEADPKAKAATPRAGAFESDQ